MGEFNHHMMTLARESRGQTQTQLAKGIKIGQGTLSKYETGILDPPDEFISALSEVLNYPEKFFMQPGRQYGLPPFHYRKRKKLSAKAQGKIVAEMNIRRMHIQKMLMSFPINSNRFIPEIDMDEYQGMSNREPDIEDVARAVRELWAVPSGPISNMVELIEENGGIIIACDFGTKLIDAMSQRIDGLPALFFINKNAPADRIRLTLSHELAHMVLHTTTFKEDDEMEREADNFAAAFLMPADEIRKQLRRFSLSHVANLKSYWKVSMAAIAVRASRLNLISGYQYKNFFIEMGKLGYRKREPNELAPERPSKLHEIVAFHQNDLEYSDSEMAELLSITESEFVEMYKTFEPRPQPKLRLIK